MGSLSDKLCGFHSTDWQVHVLRALKIRPSDKYYARSGQISMIQNYAGWYYRQFIDVFVEWFGEPRTFVRLGTSDDEKTMRRNGQNAAWLESDGLKSDPCLNM